MIALTGLGYGLATEPLRHPLPLDPAAGIALACAIVFGRSALLGVLLGSIALQLALPHLRGEPAGPALAIALGGAAVLQAGLGAWLVRRRVRQPMTLSEPREIALFFLLGAVVATAAGSVAALAARHATGAIATADLLPDALAWWSGEMLGVLLVAPIALTFIGRPRSEWAARRAVIGVSLLTLLALLSITAVEVGRFDEARAQARFERDVMAAAASLEHHLQRPLFALDAMHGVIIASEDVTRDEWRRASETWLTRTNHIQALGWSPRLANGTAADLELRDRDRDGTAPASDSLFAIQYIEPQLANASALGVNAVSIAAAREAIEHSIATRRPVATAGFRLSQDRPDERRLGIVVYRTVFDRVAAADGARVAQPRGVVSATLRIDDVLANAFAGLPAGLAICLLDRSDPSTTAAPLAGAPGCAERPYPFDFERRIAFAEREWWLRIASDSGTAARRTLGNPLLVTGVGLALAAMLGALLLGMTGRARRIEAAVAERTSALTAEVREREQAEAAMRESEQRFRNIFNDVPIGVAYADLDGQLQNINPQFCRLTGYSAPSCCG